MTHSRGGNWPEIKRKNRIRMKEFIYREEMTTRVELAKSLGLTLPTITIAVNDMLRKGILEEVSVAEEHHSSGRRPSFVRFKAGAFRTIGVELGPYGTYVCLTDAKGELITKRIYPILNENYQIMIQELREILQQIQKEARNKPILGIGIGIPGFIDAEGGLIRSNFRKDWNNRNIVGDLQKYISLPILVDNNVRLRAMAYEMACKGSRPETFAYFYISRGIACPILVRDTIVSGYRIGAGEVGKMTLCVGNKHYTADELAGEDAILEQCRKLYPEGEFPAWTMEEILRRQAQGEEMICAMMNRSVEYLGIALSNVINVMNPDFILVDAYLMKNAENRLCLERTLKEKVYGLDQKDIKLVFKPFEKDFGARAAAYLVIKHLLLQS